MKTREIIKYSSLLLLIAGIITAAVFIYRRYLPHKEEKKTENRTIVCIGDSLTFGYGVMNNRLKEAWPYLLDEMLDEYEVLNYGISGATAAKTGRKAYSGSFLDQAIEINADIYFYMLGSNDAKNLSLTAEQFRSDSLRIIERIINETKGELIILLPCPVFEVSGKTNSFGIRNEAIESIIIPVLREIAEEKGLRTVDLYELFKGKPEYFDDLVHPDKKGNKMIADLIYRNIFSNDH